MAAPHRGLGCCVLWHESADWYLIREQKATFGLMALVAWMLLAPGKYSAMTRETAHRESCRNTMEDGSASPAAAHPVWLNHEVRRVVAGSASDFDDSHIFHRKTGVARKIHEARPDLTSCFLLSLFGKLGERQPPLGHLDEK